MSGEITTEPCTSSASSGITAGLTHVSAEQKDRKRPSKVVSCVRSKTDTNSSYWLRCAVSECKNVTTNTKVSWHSFPKEYFMRNEWVRRVNRCGNKSEFHVWVPNSNSKICGCHFNETGIKTYVDRLPSLKLFKSYSVAENQKTLREIDRLILNKKNSLNFVPKIIQSNNNSGSLSLHVSHQRETDSVKEPQKIKSNFISESQEEKYSNLEAANKNLCESLMISKNENSKLASNNADFLLTVNRLKAEIGDLQVDKNDLVKKLKIVEAENVRLSSVVLDLENNNKLLNNNVQTLGLQIETKKKKDFVVENVLKDEKMLKFYTGFNGIERYSAFSNFVKQGYTQIKDDSTKTRGRPRSLSFDNELLLFLCRIRSGLLEKDLAYRFFISESNVSTICSFWITFLSDMLCQVPVWMERSLIKDTMPPEFEELYPNTTIIIDATEIFVETPSEFRIQSDTWSSYKYHTTAKGLIGIAPNSFITFVSDLVPGRMSDKELTVKSGLLELLEEGDSVMADRGFTIESELANMGVSLNIPSFMHGEPQLCLESEEQTRKIAKVRIHVERVIRSVKSFRILKSVFPNSMSDKLNKIWKICCLLCNFIDEPLLHRKNVV